MKVVNLNVSAYVPGTRLRIGAFCERFPDEPLVILSEGGGVHIWRAHESYFVSFVRVGKQKKPLTPRWVEGAFGEWVRGLDKGRASGQPPGGGDLLECCGTDVGPVPGRLKPVDDADTRCPVDGELAALWSKAILVTDVSDCARCGKDHAELDFSRFTRNPQKDGDDGVEWTHWSMCPELQEPILLGIQIP